MKLDWVKHGEMDGSNEEIMKFLLKFLPSDKEDKFQLFEMSRSYMTELWLRGISKEEFIRWANKDGMGNV